MEKFFSVIKRFNSIALLVGILFLVGLLVKERWSRHQFVDRSTVKVAAQEGDHSQMIQLSLSKPDPVAGWPLLMSRFESRPKGKFESSAGYDDGSLHNILFIFQNEPKARWLFNHHRHYIRSIEQVGFRKECGSNETCAPSTTQALLLSYAKKDTNQDQRINHDDEDTLAMTLPDGTGMVDILPSADLVLSNEFIDEHHFLIVYQKNKKLYYLKISVPDFKVVVNQEIITISDKI